MQCYDECPLGFWSVIGFFLCFIGIIVFFILSVLEVSKHSDFDWTVFEKIFVFLFL